MQHEPPAVVIKFVQIVRIFRDENNANYSILVHIDFRIQHTANTITCSLVPRPSLPTF